MEGTAIEVAFLQPGEKVIGSAYLTQDGEIVFSPRAGAIEVVLIEPEADFSGPWAIRRRAPMEKIQYFGIDPCNARAVFLVQILQHDMRDRRNIFFMLT